MYNVIWAKTDANTLWYLELLPPPSPTPSTGILFDHTAGAWRGFYYAGINVLTDEGGGGAVTGIGAAFDASFCFAIFLVKFLTPGTGK